MSTAPAEPAAENVTDPVVEQMFSDARQRELDKAEALSGKREPWCEECGHRFSDKMTTLGNELEDRVTAHEAIAYVDRLIADLRRGDGNRRSTNGLPEWSDPKWPALQRAVGALSHFPKGDAFDEMFEAFDHGLGDAVDHVTAKRPLLERCRIVEACAERTDADESTAVPS